MSALSRSFIPLFGGQARYTFTWAKWQSGVPVLIITLDILVMMYEIENVSILWKDKYTHNETWRYEWMHEDKSRKIKNSL